MAKKYFTSESVSAGHPDKIADQISDAIVDAYLTQDPEAKVACETLVTTDQVVIAGEINSNAKVDAEAVARRIINAIGYDRPELKFDGHTCRVLNLLHQQSPDINRGVVRANPEEQGAGDQGMMFGYATDETEAFMPIELYLAHQILIELNELRTQVGVMDYLRPDAKSQVTIQYGEDGKPERIHTIVISTQHDEFISADDHLSQADADAHMCLVIKHDIESILLPRLRDRLSAGIRALFDNELILHVNPTGKFVIGGPHGDTGLTGRKIIVDTYGGRGAHGGGAFSGKDPSKVDRSAAYAARHIAKNLVASGIASKVLVQLAYAIGVAHPVSVSVDTFGTSKISKTDAEIAAIISVSLDLTPNGIISALNLRNPLYLPTASYGHFGRESRFVPVKKGENTMAIELFPWEKLNLVSHFKELFNLA